MQVIDLGTIDYTTALTYQLKCVEEVMRGEDERLIFCSHPPIVTIGKQSQKEDIKDWSGDLLEVSRGGRATYHGPSQLILYPIIDLSKRERDIHLYLRNLEQSIVLTLQEYGVKAKGDEKNTGVWIENRKIASIGIAVKRWITYHGVAINIEHDSLAFTGINPCGFTKETMVSLEEILGHKISKEDFQKRLLRNYIQK